MSDEEYIAETIRLALAGDPDEGIEALNLCRTGLDHNNLHADLRRYLADRITDVLAGVKLDRALCIARTLGRPLVPFPDWHQELGAFAAVLTQRGYKPQQIAVAMCDQRAALHDKPLDSSDAHDIRTTWEPMQRIPLNSLEKLAGEYGKVFDEYPPLKNS
jgi:hypothetical protein